MAGEVEGGMGDSSGMLGDGREDLGTVKSRGPECEMRFCFCVLRKTPGRKGARAKRACRPRGYLSTLVGTTR